MESFRVLDATKIKLFAVILMVGDHIHQMFHSFGAPLWLTYPGRLVFPLFLFTAAEGFHYTRNRKNYLKRLLFASWSMTIISAILQSLLPNENVVLANNAFSTFFLTGLYIVAWDSFIIGIREKNLRKSILAILLCLLPVLAAILPMLVITFAGHLPIEALRPLIILTMLVPNLLVAEGGALMVFLGVAFYILRKWHWAQIGALLLASTLVFKIGSGMQWLMGLAAIPMLMYNGKKGKGFKWLFYIFYPAHIYLFYILSTLFSR